MSDGGRPSSVPLTPKIKIAGQLSHSLTSPFMITSRISLQSLIAWFITRDNPRVRDLKGEEILDDSVVQQLDESGFIKNLGLK